MYKDFSTSSKGIISFEADIRVSINSNPDGTGGAELVILGKGNKLPSGVSPKKQYINHYLKNYFDII